MSLRAERIRERRKLLKLTQEELAALVGTDQKQISNYENNKSDATGDTIAALAEVLQTSSDWLLGRTNDPTPPQTEILDNKLSWREWKLIAAIRRGDTGEAVRLIVNP